MEEGLRKDGERPLGREGVTEGRWALIDFNDVVAHVFLEPVRVFYDLEGLWAEATVTEVKDKPRLKTGKAATPKAAAPKPKAAKATKPVKPAKQRTPRKKKGEE